MRFSRITKQVCGNKIDMEPLGAIANEMHSISALPGGCLRLAAVSSLNVHGITTKSRARASATRSGLRNVWFGCHILSPAPCTALGTEPSQDSGAKPASHGEGLR